MTKTVLITATSLLAALAIAQGASAMPGGHRGHPRVVPAHLVRPFARTRPAFHDARFRWVSDLSWGWPYDLGAGYEATADAESPPAGYPPPPPPRAAAPVCPELLHWDTKLGRATHERLCD